MPNMQIIDELDRCKTALQVVAEMQPDGVATLLDLLIENLDCAIGQVQMQLQQCTCQARHHDPDTPVPLRRGAITVYQRPRPVHPELRCLGPRAVSRWRGPRSAAARG